MTKESSLIDLLACPKCHGAFERNPQPEGYVCKSCKLFFAVEDGLPNMLIDDAKPWPLGQEKAG